MLECLRSVAPCRSRPDVRRGATANRWKESNLVKLSRVLPVGVFVVIVLAFLWGLRIENPREIPSPLIDAPAPTFDLPPLYESAARFSSADLRQGRVTVVNVWASWCIPCRAEQPFLINLRARQIAPIFGLNYKDEPAAAKSFINQLGNPFDLIGADRDGRVGIDWGVYGVPETFVVDGTGTIRYKLTGPLVTPEQVKALIAAVKAAGAG